MATFTIVAGVLVALVVVSYIAELSRRAPEPPQQLSWAKDISIRYLDLDEGMKVRYIVAGQGPVLVLLHTLRTQLDLFQKVIPPLVRHFKVYALDYPGHGYSDIPRVEYTRDFFVDAVARFLERLDLTAVTLAGESIGGTIALLLAARGTPRVKRVIAINPYDYAQGRGIRRSSVVARVILTLATVPILGPTVMRLRQFAIEKPIYRGGVTRDSALPPELSLELYRVGNRRGYNRAFQSLLRHGPEWEQARAEYSRIDRPVQLLYGSRDWSRPEERDAERRLIPSAKYSVVDGGGHFLSLDAPEAVVRALTNSPASASA